MHWLLDMKDELKISTLESFQALGLDQPQDKELETLDKFTQAYAWLIDVTNTLKDDPNRRDLYKRLCKIETDLDEALVDYHKTLK
jgi:hypothetical protein